MAYDVLISEPAQADVEAIFHRILLHSPDAAVRFYQGIHKAIQSLAEMPYRCPIAPEIGGYDRPLRQLLFRQGRTAYRIYFFIFERQDAELPLVRIVRVRHASQRPLDLPEGPDEE